MLPSCKTSYAFPGTTVFCHCVARKYLTVNSHGQSGTVTQQILKEHAHTLQIQICLWKAIRAVPDYHRNLAHTPRSRNGMCFLVNQCFCDYKSVTVMQCTKCQPSLASAEDVAVMQKSVVPCTDVHSRWLIPDALVP